MNTAEPIDTDRIGTVQDLLTSRKYGWGRSVERSLGRERRRRSGEFRRAELSSNAAISCRKAI
jgi:hypothetical protein